MPSRAVRLVAVEEFHGANDAFLKAKKAQKSALRGVEKQIDIGALWNATNRVVYIAKVALHKTSEELFMSFVDTAVDFDLVLGARRMKIRVSSNEQGPHRQVRFCSRECYEHNSIEDPDADYDPLTVLSDIMEVSRSFIIDGYDVKFSIPRLANGEMDIEGKMVITSTKNWPPCVH